jgi:hypothetical protein
MPFIERNLVQSNPNSARNRNSSHASSAPRCKKGAGSKNRSTVNRIKDAQKKERYLRQRMVAAYQSGSRNELEGCIDAYVKSYDVWLAVIDGVNSRYPHQYRLPVRQLPDKAKEINLLRHCDEKVRLFLKPKDDGTYREIAAPGLINKTSDTIRKNVLELARDKIPENSFYSGNGGRDAAIHRLKEKAEELGTEYLAEFDIIDFYGSFHENAVVDLFCNILPINPKLVRNAPASNIEYKKIAVNQTVTHNRKVAADQNALRGMPNALRSSPYMHNTVHSISQHQLLYPTVGKDRQGLTQGSPLSPIVAEMLLSPALQDFDVVYADNILVLAATLQEIKAAEEALKEILRNHPAGHFELKPPRVSRLDQGADVLGVHIGRTNGIVTVQPTKAAWYKLLSEIWFKPALDRRCLKKINKRKLHMKLKSYVAAMPLDLEKKRQLLNILTHHIELMAVMNCGIIDEQSFYGIIEYMREFGGLPNCAVIPEVPEELCS